MKLIPLITLSLLLLCNFLYAENKAEDPISDSYIIDNLQMDSDSVPSNTDKNQLEGEIIYDNTFNDSLKRNAVPAERKKMEKAAKQKSSDKRYHLNDYRVKRNENLSVIAKKHNTTVGILKDINNIKNTDVISENSVLLVPSTKGIFYKIKPGDNLTKISKRYNAEIDVIAEHNNIDNRNLIIGRKIFIPDAVEQKEKKVPIEKNYAAKSKKTKAEKEESPGEKEIVADTRTKPDKKRGILLAWPLRGPVTSGFGIRTHPFSGDRKFHCGLDIGAEVGTIVRASGEGRVIFSGWKELYGNMVVIAHKNNYITVYAHNSKNLVGVNEKIKRGQKIALSGKTGAVTGAHLHFEIRKGIVPLNPSRILK